MQHLQLQQSRQLGVPLLMGGIFFGILCNLPVPLYTKDIGFMCFLVCSLLVNVDKLRIAYANFIQSKKIDVQAGIVLGFLLVIASLFYKGITSKVLLFNGAFLGPQISYLFITLCLITYFLSCIVQQIVMRIMVQESLSDLFPPPVKTAGSIIGSSMIYALYHIYLSWRMVVATFFVGLVFAGVYHVRRSLMLVTIAHAIFGGVCIYIMGIKFLL